MAKSSRVVPKAIATFGEKQFKETGASAVEVLRVKTAFMRKHFQQLRGITFLVAVISLDRVRVYFFDSAGNMVLGENLEVTLYSKIRKSSKLVAKFEKPKILTPEELRIEATQDLRDNLGKAIRKVSRFLAVKEPPFPDIYITRSRSDKSTQNFGLQISPDFELLFEDSTLTQKWTEGVLLRVAFLLHLPHEYWTNDAACCIGNGISLILQKEPGIDQWYNTWKRFSKETEWASVVSHFLGHKETYESDVFKWFMSLISNSEERSNPDHWIGAIKEIHDSIVIPLGTSEYHVIDGFCKTLSNPNQLVKRRHVLESIHLAPRVFCDSAVLEKPFGFSIDDNEINDPWASVKFISGSKTGVLNFGPNLKDIIESIEYRLSIEDIYPSPSGPLSHGKEIVRKALEKIGVFNPSLTTFQTKLEMKNDRTLSSKEHAVLERLSLGSLEVIANTLVGSPLIVKSLLEKGCIVFAPDFHHIGIDFDFVLKGSYDDIIRVCQSSIEATIFVAESTSIAVVSAPTSWKHPLLKAAALGGLDIWPVIDVKSNRRILRYEVTFSDDKRILTYSDGVS